MKFSYNAIDDEYVIELEDKSEYIKYVKLLNAKKNIIGEILGRIYFSATKSEHFEKALEILEHSGLIDSNVREETIKKLVHPRNQRSSSQEEKHSFLSPTKNLILQENKGREVYPPQDYTQIIPYKGKLYDFDGLTACKVFENGDEERDRARKFGFFDDTGPRALISKYQLNELFELMKKGILSALKEGNYKGVRENIRQFKEEHSPRNLRTHDYTSEMASFLKDIEKQMPLDLQKKNPI